KNLVKNLPHLKLS
ncbi:Formamidopyrimidine-DNA glycosylase, partial [Haemophilus influenzae]